MKNLILIAVQGAGKGTVAKALEEKYGYVHISTGDLLRERREVDDEIGQQIRKMQNEGALVTAEIVYQVLEEKLQTPECQKGYILDGFPRNMEQALKYDEILAKINKEVGIVINLTIPDELLISRITSRRTCKDCGKIYNINFADMSPKKEGICDNCQGALIFRDDDQDMNAISRRIQIYHDNVEELLNFYQAKDVLYNVDSTSTKDAVTEIVKLIEE